MNSHIENQYIADVATLKADVESIKKTNSRIENKLDVFITAADAKYASRESVEFLRAIILGALAAILLAGLGYALKHIFGW